MNPPAQNFDPPVAFPQVESFPNPDMGTLPPAPTAVTPTDVPPTIITSTADSGSPKKKFPKQIAAVLGIVVLLLGVVAGVVLVRSQQLNNASAWECSLYTFGLGQDGSVTVQNGSSTNQPQQEAQVYINDILIERFTVPALNAGAGTTLGSVSVPQDEPYTWKIQGTLDCQNVGSVGGNSDSAICLNVVAYDTQWNVLSASELSELNEGDTVRFAVSGTATTGTIDSARFRINSGTPVETTEKKPGSEEFFVEYEIPASTQSFSISAQLHHNTAGWF